MSGSGEFDFGSPQQAAPPAAATAPINFDQFTAPSEPAAPISSAPSADDPFAAAADPAPAAVPVLAAMNSAAELPHDAMSHFDSVAPPVPVSTKTNGEPAMSPGMRKWHEEQEMKIQMSKQSEEVAKKASREKNQAWLRDFNAEWQTKVAKKKEANRLAQQSAASKVVGWEGVCGMVDMDYAGTRDTTRMKSLLIQVKNQPPAN